ncbi:MAG: hypothetical protein UT34_C0001G0395 [candidate division WS6 bacterium GW2011_GWF2_39_15]|uniref:Uncharacterized protein n=1 Tax=candidate division WS6 bacterium GW2011_GWF2_39_15 TaxID=1619100 RepID=A0A0G0Q7E2_9BACT|nr:MAG: hypothetical protein UT34_C0001G0395 [candidate division WS6 bacterium GW2011_GWF2_39_15]
MDEGKKSNILPIILIVLLVGGMGVGGYYLGRYLDLEEAKKNSQNQSVATTKKYSNSTFKIKFDYPSDWTLTEANETDAEEVKSARSVTVKSSSGSEFIYYHAVLDTPIETDTACDEDDPNGDEDGNFPCQFITGIAKFARYENFDDSDLDLTIWHIAEVQDPSTPKVYTFDPNDYFAYRVRNNSDLLDLDKIMKSVERGE